MSKTIPVPPINAHTMKYRVPYSETDAMGRVYYANYLIWFERGRTEMLRSMGYAYSELERRGVLLPVRQCNTRYLGFAQYDDEILLATWVTDLRRARIEFTTMAFNPDYSKPITLGVVELACVNREGKPVQFPEDISSAFAGYCIAED